MHNYQQAAKVIASQYIGQDGMVQKPSKPIIPELNSVLGTCINFAQQESQSKNKELSHAMWKLLHIMNDGGDVVINHPAMKKDSDLYNDQFVFKCFDKDGHNIMNIHTRLGFMSKRTKGSVEYIQENKRSRINSPVDFKAINNLALLIFAITFSTRHFCCYGTARRSEQSYMY